MPKKEEKTEEVVEEVKAKGDPREALWQEFLANYKASNPVKYEAKEKAGQFKTIPASFRGVVTLKKGKNGEVVKIIS